MTTSQLERTLHYLRKATIVQDEVALSDGQLLKHFIEQRDEDAFAALVRRHGPMVWGVCFRTAGHYQDAEDAFQATFLVLARKAQSIRQRELLSNWLYGVALRSARKARSMAGKRRVREQPLVELLEPESVPQPFGQELAEVIDVALSRLPEKYRSAIVLCDPEGMTGKAAARQLMIPEGTLSSRLRTGRKMLGKRLARHGWTLSAAAVADLLAQTAWPGVPVAVISGTTKAACVFANREASASAVSTNVTTLTEGVLKTMSWTNGKMTLIVGIVLSLVTLASALFYRGEVLPSASAEPAGQPTATQVADTPKAKAVRNVPALPRVKVHHGIGPRKHAQAKKSKEISTAVVKYPVADLVVPIGGLDIPFRDTKDIRKNTKEKWLIRMITRRVAPKSWKAFGGTGTIAYEPKAMALIIKNSVDVQTKVNALLEVMRGFQSVEVATSMFVISLNADGYRKVQGLLPQVKTDSAVTLNEAETFALIRKSDDVAAQRMELPRVTVFSGQRVNLIHDSRKNKKGVNETNIHFMTLVAGNLRDVYVDVNADVEKVQFKRTGMVKEGTTMIQVKREGNRYLLFALIPRLILNTEERLGPAPPNALPPTKAQTSPDKNAP